MYKSIRVGVVPRLDTFDGTFLIKKSVKCFATKT